MQLDAFADYGAEKAPEPRRAKPKAEKPPSALELKMRERQRLHRNYRLWQRDHNQGVLRKEPRLVGFMRYLKTVRPETGDELLEAIEDSWLRKAAQDVRIFALRMIAARADKLNRDIGREALNDPMPPEMSVYLKARALLHEGGRA